MSELQPPQPACKTSVSIINEPQVELSKKKARRIEQIKAFKEHCKKNKQGISQRVESMTIEEAQLRLHDVVAIISTINSDLLALSKGKTDTPKMIESGLLPKVWADRARQALTYMLFERRLLLNKLQPNN